MRILLINAFHYPRGGVERTYLDESRWLTAAGHEVAHLAIRDARNLPASPADRFAPSADFGEGAPWLGQLAGLPQLIWSAPAERAAAQLVAEFRPEVAHLHAPSRYLSPAVLAPLARAQVPAVMTLHDFKPWCTNRILFAHGAPCERCRGGAHWHALTTGCVQGSRLKSAAGMIEAYSHDALHAYAHVGLWIAPSRFVEAKARELGVAADRLRVLPHGLERAPGPPPEPAANSYALFIGRLSAEKGVAHLPALARAIQPAPLRVVGDGPLRAWLEDAARTTPNLALLGALEERAMIDQRRGAAAVVVPSLFYEHFCYAAAEALLDERPVVASDIGAIPELIEHDVTGWLAAPGDVAALASGVRRALSGEGGRWAAAGATRVRELAEPRRHVAGLIEIYREAITMAHGASRRGSAA